MKKGTISYEIRGHENKKAKSNLWYVFIPVNCTKTMAEMTDEEIINRPDGRTDTTIEFIKWYNVNRYLKEEFTYDRNKKMYINK